MMIVEAHDEMEDSYWIDFLGWPSLPGGATTGAHRSMPLMDKVILIDYY